MTKNDKNGHPTKRKVSFQETVIEHEISNMGNDLKWVETMEIVQKTNKATNRQLVGQALRKGIIRPVQLKLPVDEEKGIYKNLGKHKAPLKAQGLLTLLKEEDTQDLDDFVQNVIDLYEDQENKSRGR